MPLVAWIFALVFTLALDVLGADASAQEPSPEGVAIDTRPAGNARDEEARALFEAGKVAYEDGRYQDALGYFERSYELSQRVQLQYNLGLAYDRMRRDQEALAAFEAYLVGEPDHPRAIEVHNRVRALRESLAQQQAQAQRAEAEAQAKKPPVQPPHDDHERATRRKRWLWAGIAAGVVVVGTGVIVSVVAARDQTEPRPSPNSGVTIEALTWR
jgi:tetratricopeptide (TPR) repeat protein